MKADHKIQAFLLDLQSISPDQYDQVRTIRSVFHKARKGLTEDIKYGGLAYSVSGVLVGGIYPYKNHISIEFSEGADFTDPAQLLEGGGKRRRHLKIYSIQDIDLKESGYYIGQAVS